MKSISGIIYLVEDLDRTINFYQKLGFNFRKEVEGISATAYLNWFWIEFLLVDKVVTEEFKEDAHVTPKGSGSYTHINVEDVDEFYNLLVAAGIQPESKPLDQVWSHREFVVKDPDGYKLVFFKKL